MRFALSITLVFGLLFNVSAQTINLVPSQYSTIQEAIDSSSNGDTIQIAAGTYYEYDITVNKQVTIIGADSSSTILVDTTNSDSVRCFYISALNVSIENLTIKNYHDDEHGGAIYSYNTFDAKNVHFLNNKGGNNNFGGGAVHISYGSSTPRTARFIGCRFTNNKSTSPGGQNSGGGALNIVGHTGGKDSINLTLISCVFELNETDQSNTTSDGGALYTNEAGIITISKCKFYDNRSYDKGSAIYARYSSAMNIENSLFYKNRVDDNATVFYYGTKGMFVNSTIANNISGNTDVSGLANHGTATQDGNVMATNCIFWGNDYDDVDEGGPNTYETITVSYSLIDDSQIQNNDYTDSGNIVLADPLFSDASNGLYTLQTGSPAFNSGTTTGMPADDIDGNARTNADMGAFITVCDVPFVTTQPSDKVLCLNDVAPSIDLSASGTALSYQWYSNSSDGVSGGTSLGSSNDAQTDSLSSAAFSTSASGTTYYYCILTNSCGLDTSDVVAFTVNASLDLGSDVNICTGGNAVIDAGSGYNVYDWSNGDSTQIITTSAAGEYQLTVTDSTGCVSNDTIYIDILPELSQNDTIICLGDSLSLGVGPVAVSVNYGWSTGDSSASITAKPAQTTTYTVIISDGVVSCTDSVTITVNPSVDLGSDINICAGESAAIDAGSGFNVYDWSNGDSSQTITTSVAGEYQVTVTDSISCIASDTINVGQLSEILQSDTSLCGGNSLIFSVGSNTGSETYDWSTGDSTASISAVPTQSTIYKVTVSDGTTNCFDSVIVSIAFPVIDLGADTIIKCNIDSFILDAGSGYSVYYWSTGDSSQNINVNSTGTYEISVIDSVSCQSADNVFIDFLTADILESDTTICSGDTILFNIIPDSNINSVIWSNGDTSSAINVYPYQTTNYTVSVSDGIGTCTDSVNVSIQIPKSMLGADTSICGNDSLLLDAGSNNTSYMWSTGDSVQSIYADVAGTYKVIITDSLNCSGSDSINISHIQTPIASATVTGDTLLCYGTTSTLSASASGGAPPYVYKWDNIGELNDSTSLTPTATPLSTKSFQILVTDSLGCKDSAVTNAITVREPFSAGLIDTTGEQTTYNGDPGIISELVPASGGSPPYTYLWLKDGSPVTGSSSSYDPPQASGAGTYSRYVDDSGSPNCANWTFSDGAWEVTVGSPKYNMQGSVYGSSNNLLFNVEVSLYYINSGQHNLIASLSVDSNGIYSFNNIDSGRYLVKAEMGMNISVPTYYPNSFSWMGSQEIHLTSNMTNVDINILEVLLSSTGTGYISGNLYEGNAFRGPGDPIDSIIIGLTKKDTSGLYGLDTTDANGFFEFNDLDCGTYIVLPDITGIPVDTSSTNNISICVADSSSVTMLADSTLISIGALTSLDDINMSDISIWPNPVGDKLYLQSETDFDNISIYDALGRELRFLSIHDKGLIKIKTGGIKPGIYLLELRTRNKQALVRFIKK